MKGKAILVVTNKYAPDVDRVIRKLYEMGEEVVRLNTEDFPNKIKCEYCSEAEKMHFSLPYDREICLEKIKSVLYRKVKPPEISPKIKEESLKVFARRESQAVLRAFYQCFHGLWINHPLKIRAASQKIYQLQTAKQINLNIPPTIVTNNVLKAKKFFEKYREQGVITKPLSFPLAEGKDNHYVFSTAEVKAGSFKRINQVEYAPVLFQPRIPKKYELRITVVRNKVFACKIDSQVSEKTALDWRVFDQNDPIPHEKTQIPFRIKQKCITLVKYFGLEFGAIDMIVTPENEYIFLEINPSGMWGWIEHLTGLSISKAIAQLLAKGK